MLDKAPDAFRTISEAAEELDLPQHVLRFWETKFAQIKPLKRGGGRRYYRPDDVQLLRGIQHLLYAEGYTIKGVQRIIKDQGVRFVASAWRNPAAGETGEDAPVLPVARLDRPAVPARRAPRPARAAPTTEPEERAVERPSSDPRALSIEDRRRLQAALFELIECRKAIDQALSDE